MLLTIHAPEVETRLEREAARRGLSPDEYARRLLERHLPAESPGQSEEVPPSEITQETAQPGVVPEAGAVLAPADSPQWDQAFDAWIDGHERREPLPEAAFSRASFYGERG